jgi:hypothetical protein
LCEVIASCSPRTALSRVDFPAFGGPNMLTNPERKVADMYCEIRLADGSS